MLKKNSFKAKDGASIYFAAVLCLLALQVLFSFVVVALAIADDSSGYYIFSYIASICFQLGYLAVFVVYLKKRRTRPTILLKKAINPIYYLLGIVAAIACFLFFYPAALGFDKLLTKIGLPISEMISTNSAIESVLLILATVVLAPICEELIYRSGLLSGLKEKFSAHTLKKAVLCAVISGAAFSLMHMSPRQTVFQFFLGFAAALLALSADSIIPAIILHFANNLIVILSYFFPPMARPFGIVEDLLDSPVVLAVVSIVLAAAGVAFFVGMWLLLKKLSSKQRTLPNASQNDLQIANASQNDLQIANAADQNDLQTTNEADAFGAEGQAKAKADEGKTFQIMVILGLVICAGMWLSQFIMYIFV